MTPTRARLVGALAGGAAVLSPPLHAEAHLITTGLGPVYDGLLHFAATPEYLVPVLALALLAGLRGAAHSRRALFALSAAWLLAGALGLAMGGGAGPNTAWTSLTTPVSFVLLGGCVAADVRLSPGALTVAAALLGVLHGGANGMTMGRPGLGAAALIGIAAAVFVFTALAASSVVPLRAAWARVGVRVAGSWIVAIGLLLLAWGVRGSGA